VIGIHTKSNLMLILFDVVEESVLVVQVLNVKLRGKEAIKGRGIAD